MANSSGNRLSVNIPDASITEALKKIDEAGAALDFLITLTATERASRVSIEDANRNFVNNALDEAKQRPQLKPNFVDLEEALLDIDGWSKLLPVRNRTQTLLQKLKDTMLVLGDEAWTPSIRIYSNVKEARKSGVEGAEEAYQRLKKRFEGQGKPKKGDKAVDLPTA